MSMHPDTLAALCSAIRAEIQSDPSQRGYVGKTVGQIAALMNAPIVTAPPAQHRDVSISDVEGYLRARLLVTRLRRWVLTDPGGTAQMAAEELLDIIASPRLSNFTTSSEAGRTNILGLFAALVAATGGIVTQEHYDDLAAMTTASGGAPVVEPSRWATMIEGIGAAPTPPDEVGDDGNPVRHPGYAGPPNAATEALIEEAVNGG